MKARENAESVARGQIDKINQILQKRKDKEKKAEEIFKEYSEERDFKLQKLIERRNKVKEKQDKLNKDKER